MNLSDDRVKDDPKEMAIYLIQEHGVDRALIIAAERAVGLQDTGDNYSLSVWRDVKRELTVLAAAELKLG